MWTRSLIQQHERETEEEKGGVGEKLLQLNPEDLLKKENNRKD